MRKAYLQSYEVNSENQIKRGMKTEISGLIFTTKFLQVAISAIFEKLFFKN
jgi:hypothetical protein